MTKNPAPGESEDGNLWDDMGKVGFSSGAGEEELAGEDLERLPDGSTLVDHPWATFLHRLEKPGRYTGGERNSIVKSDAELSIALAFPDVYEIGMSHLGFRILYSHLNGMEGVRAERVYAPWVDLERELRRRELPLVSLESWTPLREFDCIGFSLQYELTFTNVLTMLDLGGVPLRSEDRGEDDPLVMAGGPVAFQPEPMAPFIDAYLIGDGEGFFHDTVARWRELREQGVDRRERLIAISRLPGIYVPSLYSTRVEEQTGLTVIDGPLDERVPARISRAHVENIDDYPFPTEFPVANTEIVFDRASIEIARGCTEGCRFCQAGMIYRPVRERSPEAIETAVKDSVKCGGFDEVSLTSLSTADYSAIQPLVQKVMPQLRDSDVSMSVSSLRAYGLSDAMLDEIGSVRNTSLTFAPEAGTQRMRDVVSKNVSEEDIAKSAHRIFSRGWQRMKLYFMIGLPTEEDEDVLGIAETGRRMLGIAREYVAKGRAKVTVSVSSHVPKPFTPFQWAAQDDVPEIERKHELLREATRTHGLVLRWHDARTSHLEGILGRGDRALGAVIEDAWRKGCRFDGWSDRLRFDLWMESIEEQQIDRYRYLRTIPVDARLPWDHLDCGVEMSFLAKEYRKALKDRKSPPCGKPVTQIVHPTNLEDAMESTKPLVCYHCGIECDLKQMKTERVDFLTSLDAHRIEGVQRVTEETLEDVRARAQERREAQRNRPKLPPRHFEEQEESTTFRFRYTKLGFGRFIGHLDFARMLPRAFRRAGIDLSYSQGFHPIPQFSFGPPLRLGAAGLAELLEVKVRGAAGSISPEEIAARVNASLPEGIRLRGGDAVGAQAPRLARSAMAADSLVLLPAEEVEALPEGAIEALSAESGLFFERISRKPPRKGKKQVEPRTVDLAPGIHSVRWRSELPRDAEGLITVSDDERILELRLTLQGPEMVRPEEVLWLLFGGRIPPAAQVIRRRLLPAPDKVEAGREVRT